MTLFAWGACLALAASPAQDIVFIPTDGFTLAWTHSIEKTRWEEDYIIKPPDSPGGKPRLVLTEARIKGSAAGMEPPPGSVLRDGWFVYQPEQPSDEPIVLTRSRFVGDYDWCVQDKCQPMESILPTDGLTTLLSACGRPAP